MTYRKKLIEVSLPLEELNNALSDENKKRHGKMSTIHPYWARRPQSSCRTLLWASLVDDPSSWPELFTTPEDILQERDRLFSILIQLAQWDNMANNTVMYKAKYEIVRSISRSKKLDITMLSEPDALNINYSNEIKQINDWLSENGPTIHDPFCGGGSIPMEAYRLGMNAVGTDLNPLAIMITKTTVEIGSRFTKRHLSSRDKNDSITKISRDLLTFGQRLIEISNDELLPNYPKFRVTKEVVNRDPHLKEYIGQEFTVLAWLWARTFPTSNPAYNGAEIPTISSRCLSKKKGFYVQISEENESFEFNVVGPNATSSSSSEKDIDGTISKTGARCLFSDIELPFSYLRKQAVAGNMSKKMMAIVLEGKKGRLYASPNNEQIMASNIIDKIDKPLTELPANALGFRVQAYGIKQHSELFEPRQLKSLTTLYSNLETIKKEIIHEMVTNRGWVKGETYEKMGTDAIAYSEAIITILAMTISKLSDLSCNLSRWESKAEAVQQLFARQTVSMVWDFAESNVLSNSRGSFSRALKSTSTYFEKYIETIAGSAVSVFNMNASDVNPKKETFFFTDPPYYDNIGYADLSDFFYTWLRKYLNQIHNSAFTTILTPKSEELVATPIRNGTKDEAERFFLDGMTGVVKNLAMLNSDEYPLSFYYAFKQNEVKDGMTSSVGWATFLQSIIDSGMEVVRTFPSRTEHSKRLITMGKAGLSTNVILVCRKRMNKRSIRKSEFISKLKLSIRTSLAEFQSSGISPIDLSQAAIGPGISVYSQYESILQPDGSIMSVRRALELINEELSIILDETDNELDAESRVCLRWFASYGSDSAPYGDLDSILRSINASPDTIEKSGCMVFSKGKVEIAEIESYPTFFTPMDLRNVPVWAHVHRLIRLLNVKGEIEAAGYMRNIESQQRDSVRSLTYRLYQICDEKKMMEQANNYNTLAISWGQVADRSQKPAVSTQVTLFEY